MYVQLRDLPNTTIGTIWTFQGIDRHRRYLPKDYSGDKLPSWAITESQMKTLVDRGYFVEHGASEVRGC